ncbi:MAG: MarR family transcriptional regulator [Planctomycetota bacterium]|jgi:DNA-binding MarR family transcriptional regulator
MRSRPLEELEILLATGLRTDARAIGLREATARVLLVLEPDLALPMGEVARRLGRDPSTATRFVDRATEEGLVGRHEGRDRRRRLAHLTPRGRDVRARLQDRRDARAAALPTAVQERTGLGAGEVEWFLEAVVGSLAGRD